MPNKYSEGLPRPPYTEGRRSTRPYREPRARALPCYLFPVHTPTFSPSPARQGTRRCHLRVHPAGDTILGRDSRRRGTLARAPRCSHMGQLFNSCCYKTVAGRWRDVSISTSCGGSRGRRAPKNRAGGLHLLSARLYDYAEFKAIADEVGAMAMARKSRHIGGWSRAARCAHPSTTVSTSSRRRRTRDLRGPRGGLIICTKQFADRHRPIGFFTGLQGGPI